jgi:hypothetical protein
LDTSNAKPCMPLRISVWPVAIQILSLQRPGSSALQNLQHLEQSGRIDAGIDDDLTILANDNHHPPVYRSRKQLPVRLQQQRSPARSRPVVFQEE